MKPKPLIPPKKMYDSHATRALGLANTTKDAELMEAVGKLVMFVDTAASFVEEWPDCCARHG